MLRGFVQIIWIQVSDWKAALFTEWTQEREQKQLYCEIIAFLFSFFYFVDIFKDVWNICGGLVAAISKRP